MSALVPADAVCMLYRRYLKSANNITNITMRMMLTQQIRNSFRRHSNVRSAAAQRELIVQAHKDLAILEDSRLQRSLYINRLGMVSCIDWESRHTEFHLDPSIMQLLFCVLAVIFLGFNALPFFAERPEDLMPDSARAVDMMIARAHGSEDLAAYAEKERERIEGMLSTSQRQRALQRSIFTTFEDSPHPEAPKSPPYRYASVSSL